MQEEKQSADYKNSFAASYFKSMENSHNNEVPHNQDQNIPPFSQPKPLFKLNQNSPVNNKKSKGWFDSLSNNWKAFLINVGTGIGAAFLDTAVYSMPIDNYHLLGIVVPSYGVTTWAALPLLRHQLYLRFLKEKGKSYKDLINNEDYYASAYKTASTYQQPHTDMTREELDRQIDIANNAHNDHATPERLKTTAFHMTFGSLITTNISWVLTHILLQYALGGKKTTDDI